MLVTKESSSYFLVCLCVYIHLVWHLVFSDTRENSCGMHTLHRWRNSSHSFKSGADVGANSSCVMQTPTLISIEWSTCLKKMKKVEMFGVLPKENTEFF